MRFFRAQSESHEGHTSSGLYVERRRARAADVCLRRRGGQLRHANPQVTALSLPIEILERRHSREQSFDVAAALELHLNEFPTKPAMLTLLRAWLYAAETNELAARRPEYVQILRRATEVVQAAPDPAIAIARLQSAAVDAK